MSDQVSPRHIIEADVVAIGAGQAAVPFVRAVAKNGTLAVLVERRHLGGSCVNFGCTPSKAALASASHVEDARKLARFGVTAGEIVVDFATVMARARGFAQRARSHLAETLSGQGNLTLICGHARLWGQEGKRFCVVVDDGPMILAERVILDTGTRSIIPPIPGLDMAPVITAETWLDLDRAPTRLLILGAGPVGVEMAQLDKRLGAEVTIVDRASRILANEDSDVAEALHAALAREGIGIRCSMTVLSVTTANAEAEVTLDDGTVLHASHIFVAVGRRAAVEELGLDSLDLAPARGGTLAVDAHLGTSVPGVYAAGDIRGGLPFTQTAWNDHCILLAMFPGFPGHTTRRVAPMPSSPIPRWRASASTNAPLSTATYRTASRPCRMRQSRKRERRGANAASSS